MKGHRVITATIGMLAALQLSLEVRAEEPVDSSGWLCNFCTYAAGWFGSLDIGPGYASDSSLKFADYRGIEDEDAFMSVYGDIHFRNSDGRYFDLYARNLGTHSRQLEIRGGREGRFELHVAYDEIPKYRGFGTTTPYRDAGNGQLLLPPDWVQAPTTAGMSSLTDSLTRASLHTLRKNFVVGLSFKKSVNWRYELDVQHTEKNGTRPFGAGVFTIQSSHFPAPVDFSTDRVDMSVEYSGERAHMRVGFGGSWFNNGNASVSWENPFNPIGNTQLLRAALEPDSNFQQFNFSGAYRVTPGVRLLGNVTIGQIKQDQAFLPYSINPDFDDLLLPRASLNGKIDTGIFNLATRLMARLSPNLKLSARIKIDERDNSSPVNFYTPVSYDYVLNQDTANRPYSFKRNRYSLELDYRSHPFMRWRAGVKRNEHARTLQSVTDTKERTWWGELNFNHWATAQLRLRLEASDRDNSPYVQVINPGLRENVLMRKFNLAGRDRDRFVIELDLSPADRLSAGISYYMSKDDYQQSVLGVLHSEERSFSIDLGYALNNKLGLHMFFTQDSFDSEISGAGFPGATAWMARTEDRFTTFGAGFTGKLSDKMDISLDYISSDSRGRIGTDSGSGEAPFPELESDLVNTRVRLNYTVNDQWSWILIGEHENYRSKDWQIDGLGNDGISAILSFGGESPDYSINLLRLMASYRF